MLRSYFKPPPPLFIASFAIFDKVLPFYCLGQQPSRTTFDDGQSLDLPATADNRNNNGTHEKLIAITITSNYIVTLTSTSYSYSSLITTITGLPSSSSSSSSSAILPGNTATIPSSRSSSANSSNDTAILIGSLVGGITGVLLIGLGVYLFFFKKDRKTTLPTMDPDYDDDDNNNTHNNDYRIGKSKRMSYGRAFVPPLADAYPIDPSLSTPSVETNNPHSYHPSYYRPQDKTNQSSSAEDGIRHVPDETNHALGAERHVPHLVD